MHAVQHTSSPVDCLASSRPLSEVSSGEHVQLQGISAGKRLHEKLLSMGLPIGTEFTLLQNRGGSVVIAHDTNRLAIGKGMAQKIHVSLAS
ncbi:MAG: FeoA family protein [bacterium]